MHFIKLYKLFYFEPFGTISDHVFFNFLFENLEFFTTNIKNDELVIFLEYLRKSVKRTSLKIAFLAADLYDQMLSVVVCLSAS